MDKILKLMTTALLCFFIVACSTAGRLHKLEVGMPKQDALEILGKPNSVGASSGVEVLHYVDDNGWWRYSYYFVRLVDGKVESFGPESKANPVTASSPPIIKP